MQRSRKREILLAVASASKNSGMVLRRLEIFALLDYVADAAKIARSKPDPEVFEDCARALLVTPLNCVGFEDALAGIEAFHAAGMFAVDIGNGTLAQNPDLVVSDTRQLDVDIVIKKAFGQ